MASVGPFCELFDSLMDNGYYHNNRTVSEMTESLGRKVSLRNIQRYRARTTVPSLENAIVLMEALNQTYSVEEIIESLQLEKDFQTISSSYEESTIAHMVTIRYDDLNDAIGLAPGYDVETLLNERVQDLCGTQPTAFSRYVRDLIAKDIKENILGENDGH